MLLLAHSELFAQGVREGCFGLLCRMDRRHPALGRIVRFRLRCRLGGWLGRWRTSSAFSSQALSSGCRRRHVDGRLLQTGHRCALLSFIRRQTTLPRHFVDVDWTRRERSGIGDAGQWRMFRVDNDPLQTCWRYRHGVSLCEEAATTHRYGRVSDDGRSDAAIGTMNWEHITGLLESCVLGDHVSEDDWRLMLVDRVGEHWLLTIADTRVVGIRVLHGRRLQIEELRLFLQ